jgi:hypothetical protein
MTDQNRSGTHSAPYTRRDGVSTRSTTMHLDIEVHRKLRIAAVELNTHMSTIIDAALRDWLLANQRRRR